MIRNSEKVEQTGKQFLRIVEQRFVGHETGLWDLGKVAVRVDALGPVEAMLLEVLAHESSKFGSGLDNVATIADDVDEADRRI